MERGDTGLGRDAYGLPRRERDRLGYGPESYPSDDGYPAAAEEDDAAGPGRAVDAEEDDYGQLLRRPGEMPPRQQRLRQPGRPHPGQPGRFPRRRPPAPSRQALSRQMASRATAAGPVTACPTALGRADLRARAGRTAGTQMAACPTGQCRMAGPQMAACPTGQYRTAVLRTAYRTAPPSTALRRIAPRRIAVPRTPARHTAVSRTAVSRTAGPCLMAGRYPADSPGCRTGAGYRRARTACTDRLGPARRAGHQGGTTGLVRPPRTRTPTVGAARRQHRGQAHRGRAHRGQAPVPEDRPQVRLTGVRSPTAVPGGIPGVPGVPGVLGSPPLREHPPAGPRFDAPDGRERLGPPVGPPLEPPAPVIRRRETAGPRTGRADWHSR